MDIDNTRSDEGGWKHYELPRSEYYAALEEVLAEFSEFLLDDPEAARKLDHYPYNDWFFGGYGGGEDAFYLGLWPAELATVELYENGEISMKEFRAECWPKSNCQELKVYVGDADAIIELAEDEAAARQFADSLAELAGIMLVEDWDPGEEDESVSEDEA